MKIYELTVLLKPDLGEKELDKSVKDLQALLTKNGAKVKSKNDPAKRSMAYQIVKGGRYRDAYYMYLELETEPGDIQKLEEQIKLNDSIIRHLLCQPNH